MNVGVLALQGAFVEHETILQQLGVETTQIRMPEQLAPLDALIIPGGESTTIGKLAMTYGLIEPLRTFARHKPVWGTCAGMIFVAKNIDNDQQPLLGLADITVRRNAFGRQIDSFEANLDISVLVGKPFPAVFIRAPVITAVEDTVDVLCVLNDRQIVAAQQGHLLMTSFHPELTHDSRLHEYFLSLTE